MKTCVRNAQRICLLKMFHLVFGVLSTGHYVTGMIQLCAGHCVWIFDTFDTSSDIFLG